MLVTHIFLSREQYISMENAINKNYRMEVLCIQTNEENEHSINKRISRGGGG